MAENVRPTGKPAAAIALAKGQASAAAAVAADVSERTVRRWLEDPTFAAEVTGLRATMLDNTIGQLADAASDAVATLRLMLGAKSEAVRVRAARSILAAVVVLRESIDLEERIAGLERATELESDR